MLNRIVKDAVPYGLYAALPMETMGDRIRQLRIARGLTQSQLGELCDVTKSAVSQWEDGSTSNIKLQTFMKLCLALQTDPEYLIWGEDRGPELPGDTAASGRFRRPRSVGRRS